MVHLLADEHFAARRYSSGCVVLAQLPSVHDSLPGPSRQQQAMTARCVMVLGTSSGAGKSWLAAALCRWYALQGLRVAPFKAQNMSNNARVVPAPDGRFGEIGSAQYHQALAARAQPTVWMNPVLLKPEADTRSQVVVLGEVDSRLAEVPWRERGGRLWPVVADALDRLRAQHDVVVIEGAGSPAEINLHDSDFVNMRVALHADARCLVVADIDRGGAFAHLYGTWALLPENERALIRGFVLNKFRGDEALLAPGPQMLRDLTGVPVVATIPFVRDHGLPEEDGVFDDSSPVHEGAQRTIAVIAYPRISNLDEFEPLRHVPGVRLVWARAPADCAGADWVVLPGSKHTSSDLAWLRAQHLDDALARHAVRGGAVLGVCGGLQMLGEALVDPHGIDGNAPGLGLLPVVSVFEPAKTVRRTQARFDEVGDAWSALSHIEVDGYEIHHGQTAWHPAMPAGREVIPGLAWQNAQGNVLGVYLHGLFEDARVMKALFGAKARELDATFDRLAALVDARFGADLLDSLRHS
jgi:adenosylcobyric acid synthase